MSVEILEQLRHQGYQSSLATSYDVNLAFYEDFLEHRMRLSGCTNNAIIADSGRLHEAFADPRRRPRRAGLGYALVPVSMGRGAFHPKILLQTGPKRGRLYIGSANVTRLGMTRNIELITQFRWQPPGGSNEEAARRATSGRMIRAAYDFVRGWLDADHPVIARYIDVLQEGAPWLADTEPAPDANVVELPDGSAVGLLLSRGAAPGIMDRFLALVGPSARRLIVVSPYWDANLAALVALMGRLGGPETLLLAQPTTNRLPKAAARARPEFHNGRLTLRALGADTLGFLHAKLLVVETDDADWVLSGSANCSDEALGGHHDAPGGVNAEACVVRRMVPGSAIAALGLSLETVLQINDIADLPPDDIPTQAEQHPYAGHVEIFDGRLRWWPVPNVPAQGARAIFVSGDLAKIGSPAALCPADALGAVETAAPPDELGVRFVAFELADGRTTVPALVHDVDRLRASAPRPGDSLSGKVEAYLSGPRDPLALLEIARQVSDLVEDERGKEGLGDQRDVEVSGSGRKPGPGKGKGAKGYVGASQDRTRLFLRILSGASLKCTASPEDNTGPTVPLPIDEEELVEQEEDLARISGEEEGASEDGPSGENENSDEQTTSPTTHDGGAGPSADDPKPPEPCPLDEPWTLRRLNEARAKVRETMARFCKRWEAMAEAGKPVGTDEAVLLGVLIQCLAEAAAYTIAIPDAGERPLVETQPRPGHETAEFGNLAYAVASAFFKAKAEYSAAVLSALSAEDPSAKRTLAMAWGAAVWSIVATGTLRESYMSPAKKLLRVCQI